MEVGHAVASWFQGHLFSSPWQVDPGLHLLKRRSERDVSTSGTTLSATAQGWCWALRLFRPWLGGEVTYLGSEARSNGTCEPATKP